MALMASKISLIYSWTDAGSSKKGVTPYQPARIDSAM
jgi:hypothetical protein